MTKIDRSYLRYIRYTVQWGIFIFLLYAGYQFFLFVDHYESGGGVLSAPPVNRPPSVEGFLPIGALMSFKLWLTEGIFDRIHPAGLTIFVAAVLMSLFLRKSFCGWICPVGAVSDLAGRIGRKIWGRNPRMNRFIDYPLRSVKYLLMGFFIYVIIIRMPSLAILRFLEGDYYKIADVKMLYFFTRMTTTTLVTLLALLGLSLFYRNFWCRYLCPYGALLGLLGTCSLVRITRNDSACIHCKRCTEHCPVMLPVEEKARIVSPECTGCLTCVSQCPSRGALDIGLNEKKVLSPPVFAAFVVILFFSVIGFGMLTGRWGSAVSHDDYARLVPQASFLDHP